MPLEERGHTMEDCRTLKDHLGQLEKAGQLRKSCLKIILDGQGDWGLADHGLQLPP